MLADRNRILARPSIRADVGRNDRAVKCTPFGVAHLRYVPHDEVVKILVRIDVLSHWLNLQKWNVASEFDWYVGLEDLYVVKQGAEPGIGFDDPFERLIR
jgi:hypothetical protein